MAIDSTRYPVCATIGFQDRQQRNGRGRDGRENDARAGRVLVRCHSVRVYRAAKQDDPDPIVLMGSLDHPEDWPQEKHVGIESKVPWHVIGDDLPQLQTDVSKHVEAAKAQEFYSARESSRLGDRR